MIHLRESARREFLHSIRLRYLPLPRSCNTLSSLPIAQYNTYCVYSHGISTNSDLRRETNLSFLYCAFICYRALTWESYLWSVSEWVRLCLVSDMQNGFCYGLKSDASFIRRNKLSIFLPSLEMAFIGLHFSRARFIVLVVLIILH